MNAVADRYRALAREFTRRVETVADENWDNASPCAGWSARDVLRHVLETHRTTPTYVGLELGVDTSPHPEPRAAWARARDAMQAVLDDPDRATREYDGFFGRTALRDTVDRFVCFDLLVHGWDIARATGQDETFPSTRFAASTTTPWEWARCCGRTGSAAPRCPWPTAHPNRIGCWPCSGAFRDGGESVAVSRRGPTAVAVRARERARSYPAARFGLASSAGRTRKTCRVRS